MTKKKDLLLSLLLTFEKGKETICGYTEDVLYNYLVEQEVVQGRSKPALLRHLIVQAMERDGNARKHRKERESLNDAILERHGEILNLEANEERIRQDQQDAYLGEIE